MTLQQALGNLAEGRAVPESFEAVYAAYHGRVAGFLRLKGLKDAEALDAAQEVFLSVYRNLHQLRDPDRFEPWLFTIARNRAMQHHEFASAQKRDQARSVDLDAEPRAVPDKRPDPLEELLDREKLEVLTRTLETLPPQMRRCVAARIIDQYSVQEIADSLGISVNTIKVHLHRARPILQERLRAHFGEVVPDE